MILETICKTRARYIAVLLATIFIILQLVVSMKAQTIPNVNKTIPVTLVSIVDGDTVRLRFDNNFEFFARLAGIDAPELGQPYGSEAKDRLENLIGAFNLRVWIRAEDSFNRKLVFLIRDNYLDINLKMLEQGNAWKAGVPRRFRKKYRDAERKARETGAGLWNNPEACAPWKWRKLKCPGQ